MATAQDVVRQALKKSGVIGEGETPSSETLNDGLSDLNDMIAQWVTERWMIFHLLDVGFAADGRITPYTVGPSGDYNVLRRPDQLQAAYLRQFTDGSEYPVDTPLKIWTAREQYSMATLKSTFVSYPAGVFLDPKWPLADLYVYPWPSAGQSYSVHLIMKDSFPTLLAATDLSTYPTHYIPAMKFCLARRMRQGYGKGMKPDPELNALARQAISTVKNSNLAIPDLQMPPGLPSSGGVYNIYSDSQS